MGRTLRAKIMLLSSGKRDEINALYAGPILAEVSSSFNHTFSILQSGMGGRTADGSALSDKTVDACRACQAVLVCDGEQEALSELYDALDMSLSIRCLTVPEVLCGRDEKPVSLYLGTVLSLDGETLRRAWRAGFAIAQEADIRLCHVAPTGATREDWEAAALAQEAETPQISAAALSAQEAVKSLIKSPERMGLILCPPYAGGILLAAASALCRHPEIMHEMALEENIGVYSAWLPEEGEEAAPFSAALSVSKLLRYSLRMPREAACVEAAVNNVIASGWRMKSQGGDGAVSGEGVMDRICEQITVAGELMQRAGL